MLLLKVLGFVCGIGDGVSGGLEMDLAVGGEDAVEAPKVKFLA